MMPVVALSGFILVVIVNLFFLATILDKLGGSPLSKFFLFWGVGLTLNAFTLFLAWALGQQTLWYLIPSIFMFLGGILFFGLSVKHSYSSVRRAPVTW